MTTAIASPALFQQDSTLAVSTFSRLTREELVGLIRAEENLPESISVSDYWELYQNELEFE